MSLLTAAGRRHARDMSRRMMVRGLTKHEWFIGVPGPVVHGFAELMLVSRELRARIKAEGIVRPDGSVNPCVEAFRKYKHTELGYLQAIAELKRDREGAAVDLVAQLAHAASAETAPAEAEPVAEPGSDPSET